MKRYTIEEVKNKGQNLWVEGEQKDLDKLLKAVGGKPINLYEKEIFHFYLQGKEFGGWNEVDGMAQRGKEIIKFSQIDFQEKGILEFLEIY